MEGDEAMRTRVIHLLFMLIAVAAMSAIAQADEVRRRVLVLPFEEISANPSQDWIGQAVSQSLVAELSQMPQLQPTAGTLATSQADRALRIARDAGAHYVVIGGYQLLDPQLRITGQVMDVASGQVIGGLKATGTVRDLFGMQDTLGAQAKRIVRQHVAPSPTTTADPATTAQPADPVRRPIESSGPLRISQYQGSSLQQAVKIGRVPAQSSYSYSQAYTNYTYGYPYMYGQPSPGGYYGMPLYWGYPPPITSGYWPVVPGYGRWYYWPGRVIITPPGKHHPHHPGKHHSGSHHVSGTSLVIRVER